MVDILLIEDNLGDARLIEEMLPRSNALVDRVEGDDIEETASVELHHETRLADGVDAIDAIDPDVVLLDLGLPDSRGLETLTTVLDHTNFIPVVVLTGVSDESVGIDAIEIGAQEYLVKGEVSEDLLVRALYHAIERNRQERERQRRQDQLETLFRLNEIGQDIAHAVISVDTREDLERIVCERLVTPDRYQFAWIGEVEQRTTRVDPRLGCGQGGVLLEAETDEVADWPTQQVIQTGTPQAIRDVKKEAPEPWREIALERGIHGVAAVPIAYEEYLYGVLVVYATVPGSFSDPALSMIARLGDIVAHAITALERKDALLNETVLQLDFTVEGWIELVSDLTARVDGSIHFDHLVLAQQMLIFGHAEGITTDDLTETFRETPTIEDMRVLVHEGEWCKFELVTDAIRPLSDAITSLGGSLESATIEDGTCRFTVEFPAGRDKRQLVELVESNCQGASFVAQRTVERTPDEIGAVQGALNRQLTEKQRLVLRSSYHAGFYEWPRESSGQEIAERLGISPATFSQHMRSAERKVFAAIFDDAQESVEKAPIHASR